MGIYFATGNKNKVEEAQQILAAKGITVRHFPFSHVELRSDSLEEIAVDAVKAAYAQLQKPVFVEDTGLFIDALNGFPGTYSAWVYGKLGTDGILKLMHGKKERVAVFRTVLAFADGHHIKTFSGGCSGTIAKKARGSSGFGYDQIFSPLNHDVTFAESIQLKSELSHRYKSLLQFSQHLTER